MRKPIRIVVVDDSLTIRAMIETLLERDCRFEVAGIGRDGEEATDLIHREKPDVVTLDVAMPGGRPLARLPFFCASKAGRS